MTVGALVASGHVAQLPFHLNKAMDGGLTQTQAGEVITHLAFYIGWPQCILRAPGGQRPGRSSNAVKER